MSSDPTPPQGIKAIGKSAGAAKRPKKRIPAEPVTTEVTLGGSVPRAEPSRSPLSSGDLYVRLEGRIYGPFQPQEMEELLQSGRLTGLEVASPDLHRWTPLAYHPRIVRSRVRDFDRAHDALRQRSALPAKKSTPRNLPLAAVVRRPPRRDPGQSETPPRGRPLSAHSGPDHEQEPD